jgi:DEAD/DEAH box helicase domain-containing protein
MDNDVEDIQLFESGQDDSLGLNSVTRLIELLKNPQQGHITETHLAVF